MTVERVRSSRTGRRALYLKLTPSASTDTDGVRFWVEETKAAVDPFKLLVEPTRLTRDGFRLIRHATAMRLGIEVWR